jgi:hypothetical protein
MFPNRLDRLAEITFDIRPIINVDGDGGGGALTDFTATYYGAFFFAGLRLQPFGLGYTREGTIISSTLTAEAGYNCSDDILDPHLEVKATPFAQSAH